MRLLLALLLAASPLPSAAQSGVPMEWPEPVRWGESLASARVAGAVREALASSHWAVEAEAGGSIAARYDADGRWLRVRIDYGPREVRYEYGDSGNFAYEELNGERYIHRRVNKLMRRLDRQVFAQVQLLRGEDRPAEVVPIDPPSTTD